jgi:phytoene synthase
MSEAGADDAAAAFCADLVRAHDFDRYAATLFVDPDKRRPLLALAAFNVEIVRVRGQVTQPLPGEIRLQWWTDMLAGASHGGVEGNPVAAELKRAIDRCALPVAPLTRLIEAHLFDLYNDPMPDIAVLDEYLADTDGALLALAARVLGQGSDATDHVARHAGIAIGIARIVARLGYDSSRRQLYLPNDMLARHGCDLEQLFAGQSPPALRAVLNELIAYARQHLDQAMQELAGMPRETRRALLPLALARRDLDRLAQPNRDVLAPDERARLATLWTLWRASRSGAFRE